MQIYVFVCVDGLFASQTHISGENAFFLAVFTINFSHWTFVHVFFQKFSENFEISNSSTTRLHVE